MNIPPNTILQFSDINGNISHQGIIASNIDNTELLTTFPITATGTSVGTYQHLGITGTTGNQSNFLNVSGTHTGGFNFWTSNSTDAPILLADITKNGISIVKSTISPNYNTYATLGTGVNYIILDINPSGPPYSWIRDQMYIIQVGNTTATMSVGVNYNVRYVDTQVVTVHATTDPNSPIIDSTGITSVLLPYGSTPVVSASTTLNEDLVLTDTVITSTLNKSSLTLSTTASGISSQISNTAVKSQNSATNLLTQMTPNGISVRDLANSIGTLVANNRVLVNSDITGYGGTLTDSYLTINNGANISQLTATDLTFNTTSMVSSIRNMQIKATNVINQYISAAIYADGRPPAAPTTTIAQTYAYTPSWYFKNSFASNNKINWYIGATPNMIVSDILGLYVSFFNSNMISNDDCPFVTVYTSPTGSGDYAPGFYHSAMTYVFSQSVTPVVNTRYCMFANITSCPTPDHYGSTLVAMETSTVNNPRGDYQPTQSVAFLAIGTNSASAQNSVEFAISKIGIMQSTGTTEVNFFPV